MREAPLLPPDLGLPPLVKRKPTLRRGLRSRGDDRGQLGEANPAVLAERAPEALLAKSDIDNEALDNLAAFKTVRDQEKLGNRLAIVERAARLLKHHGQSLAGAG